MKPLLYIAGGLGVLYLLDPGLFSGLFGTTAVAASGTPGNGTSTSPQGNTNTSVDGSTDSTTGGASSAQVPTPNGGMVAIPTTLSGLQAYVHNWAAIDGNFSVSNGQLLGSSVYHWSYYVNMGAPTTANMNLQAAFPGANLNSPMSESVFWAGMGPYLSASYGLSGMGGLGMLAHFVNPYLQGPRSNSQVFGAGLAPRGIETNIITKWGN